MTTPASASPCPPDFLPLFRTSPFLDATGPFYYKPLDVGFLIGLRALDKHANAKGTVHGGLVATLADVSLGYVTGSSRTPTLRMVTASLSIDYVGSAQVGQWIESQVTVTKTGNRLAFAQASIWADGAPVATAKAVFLVI